MDESQAMHEAVKYIDQLRQAVETRDAASRTVIGLRKILEGLVELHPIIEEHVPTEYMADGEVDRGPRGMAAARAALEACSTFGDPEWMSVANVHAFLERNGWGPSSSNPVNAVRAALDRLVETGEAEKGKASKSGQMMYRLKQAQTKSGGGYDDFGEEPF